MVKDFKAMAAATQGSKPAGNRFGGGGGGGFGRGAGGFGRGGGGRGRGGGGGGFGGGDRYRNDGPPDSVDHVCDFSHACGNQIVVKAFNTKVIPKFFRGVYYENQTKVGKVDQIFGPINNPLYSVTLEEGIQPTSFKEGQPLYLNINNDCLPIDRFLPKPKGAKPSGGGGGGGRGRGRGAPGGGFNKFGGGGGGGRGGGFGRGGGGFGRGGFKQK